ncbi:MAG: amino acid permease [Rhodospirillales bacterium]|nr:amino acid permease [Rhodospirillales bacterium]
MTQGNGDVAGGGPQLRRVLTFWPLVLYGLGVIVGAGIYVAIGAVIGRAGMAAPTSFLLAGIAAGATGLCYAELAGRYPEASGGVAYVAHGFGSRRLALLTGLAITLAVTVGAASIARGAVAYLTVLLPLPAPWVTGALVVLLTVVAIIGVRESVGLAAAMTIIELAGLLAATIAGLHAAPRWHIAGLVPASLVAWRGALAGAFIAFFAFIGFETLANLAEETADPRRTIPRGILGAIAISILLYVAVAAAAVLAGRSEEAPLLGLFPGTHAVVFAVIGAVAVGNGVLVQIVMLARLFYGMASKGELPAWLGLVHPRSRTPIPATLIAGAIVTTTAVAIPFRHLLSLTNAVTLCVFALVDLALWRAHRREPTPPAGVMSVPGWLPPLAVAFNVVLIAAELLFQV